MKLTTNEEIFENVRENGYITEREINLLKNRSNNERRDVFNYELLDEVADGYGVPVTPEQGAKGLRWLRGLLKSNGEPRKGQGLGLARVRNHTRGNARGFPLLWICSDGQRGLCLFCTVVQRAGHGLL